MVIITGDKFSSIYFVTWNSFIGQFVHLVGGGIDGVKGMERGFVILEESLSTHMQIDTHTERHPITFM